MFWRQFEWFPVKAPSLCPPLPPPSPFLLQGQRTLPPSLFSCHVRRSCPFFLVPAAAGQWCWSWSTSGSAAGSCRRSDWDLQLTSCCFFFFLMDFYFRQWGNSLVTEVTFSTGIFCSSFPAAAAPESDFQLLILWYSLYFSFFFFFALLAVSGWCVCVCVCS